MFSSRQFNREENAFIIDNERINKNGIYRAPPALDNEEGRLRTGPPGSGKGPRGPAAAHRDGDGMGHVCPARTKIGQNGAGLKIVGTPAPSE